MRTAWALTIGGCTCWGVYLPGGCTCPGVPAQGGGVPAQGGGVPAQGGGVPARGCTCRGCTFPEGGVPAGGCTCQGVYLPRYSPCEQNDRQVQKYYLVPNFVCGR